MRNYKIPALLFLTAASLLLGGANTAKADQPSRLYFAGYLGLSMPRDAGFSFGEPVTRSGEAQFDNATSLAGALGLRLTPELRVELEYSWRKNDLSSMSIDGVGTFAQLGDMTSNVYLANFYYDFDRKWHDVTPFISFGLGAANTDLKVTDVSTLMGNAEDDGWDVAWQLGAGVNYKVNDTMTFTGGYRYLDMGSIKAGGYELDNSAHEIRVGLQYNFPVSRK